MSLRMVVYRLALRQCGHMRKLTASDGNSLPKDASPWILLNCLKIFLKNKSRFYLETLL